MTKKLSPLYILIVVLVFASMACTLTLQSPVVVTTSDQPSAEKNNPTPVVENPAADVPAGGPSVSNGNVCDMTTAEAKRVLGVDVQRLGTEDCSWVFRVPGGGSTFTANLPDLWVATITETDGKVIVYDGESNLDITGWAATYRYAPGFSADDAVNVPCEILKKEQDFGNSETPSFEVSAGNFTCP